jgi:hypothetical protein
MRDGALVGHIRLDGGSSTKSVLASLTDLDGVG